MCEKVIIALVSVAIGGCISFFSARAMYRSSQRNIASEKFRSAFRDVIYLLERGSNDIRVVITDDIFESHEKSKMDFLPFLSKAEHLIFDEAWSKYYKYIKWSEGQVVAPGNITVRESENGKLLVLVLELTSFATHK